MNDLHRLQGEVEKLLLDALAAIHPALSPDAAIAVTEYLGHNELELALREIQSVAEKQGIRLPAEAVQSLTRAAFLMGINL